MSIIKYFLEKTNEDTSYLFKNTKIEKESEIMKKQGKYPLIYFTFKDEKHNSFDRFVESMTKRISSIYKEFYYLYESLEFNSDREYFNRIIDEKSSVQDLESSLFILSKMLKQYHNEKVIILIDEYDTPIHQGYFKNYYSDIIEFIRNLLSAALKDNINLEKSMLTGILRVAKESIFSGLNNLKVYSLLSEEFSSCFGFTEVEIGDLLNDFECNHKASEFKKWYNVYIFGNRTIYNPWSALYYLSSKSKEFLPYWVNTSENKIIKTILAEGTGQIKLGLEKLYNGGYIETTIKEDIIMSEIDNSEESLWSFLLLSGYLKIIDRKFEDRKYYYKLAIPNYEILSLYEEIIEKWFQEGFISNDFTNMLRALIVGEVELFEEYFSDYVLKSFSYFDVSGENPEKVYHAFILGMLVSLNKTHEIVSNRESGLGRYDVSLIPKDISKPGIIMEFKSIRINSRSTLEQGMERALNQINKKMYDTELRNRGIENIIKIALVFKGKEVLIKEV